MRYVYPKTNKLCYMGGGGGGGGGGFSIFSFWKKYPRTAFDYYKILRE